MSIAYPEFRASRCTRYRFRYSACSRCADACPHDAVALTDEGVRIDPARCQNCALCVTACPTDALASEALKPVDMLRQAIRHERFAIACAPSGASGDVVVPCLGAVDAASLAYLAKRRIPVTLRGVAHCERCAHGARGAAQLASNLDACALLQDAAASADKAADWIAPQLDEADGATAGSRGAAPFAAGRRQWFRRLVGRGVAEVARPADAQARPPDKAIRPGPYALPERRELLQIVCTRKDDQPFGVPLHDALPMMALSLQPGCTTCEACFRVCPTGAIQIEESPANYQLEFDADRCVACAVCLEVCQPRVLDADMASSRGCRSSRRWTRPPRVMDESSRQAHNTGIGVQPTTMKTASVLHALLAAALFGASTPFAKLLVGELSPWLLAGLLYLGSGLGLAAARLIRDRGWRPSGLAEGEWPWLLGAILFGGVLGPLALMFGLTRASGSTASLLLNLEAVLTAVIAWVVFKENADRRIVLGMLAIVAGGAVLSLSGGQEGSTDWAGPLAIVAACLCWAIDNNLTRRVSASDALFIAGVKGAMAGVVNTGLALALGATLPGAAILFATMSVGLLGYGISLVLFVLALRGLGTARTGAYFSTAPFIGAAVSLVVLGESTSAAFWFAAALMGWGVWLHLTEHHEHEHVHEPMEHSHRHVHDEHHRHEHDFDWQGDEPHEHRHSHPALTHKHPHFPDIHHRHSHPRAAP